MLRWSLIVCAVWAFAVCLPCAAQDNKPGSRRSAGEGATAEIDVSYTRTPEMWFYEQEWARHDNPKMAVRRKAELRGIQRAERIAAMKWYGKSNSRPTVQPTAAWSSYSASWNSNTYDPMRWRPYFVPSTASNPVEARY